MQHGGDPRRGRGERRTVEQFHKGRPGHHRAVGREGQIPAETLIRTDSALIPLNGDQARFPLDQCSSMDFRQPRSVGAAVIDACFGDLSVGPGGRAETVLRNPGTGDELRVWQKTGLMHVFTGDTLARDRRRSIALEPVEAMTNAFNRDELAAAVRLEPGRQRRFRFGVGYTPSNNPPIIS